MNKKTILLVSLVFVLLAFSASGALTERYVTVTGAGAHDGSFGGEWTLAEALTNAVAGDRCNVLKGAYSSGADSVTNAGTTQAAIIFRGYNSVIGDLVGARITDNGPLITTNYPVITLTGLLTPNVFVYFEAIKFIASLPSDMIGVGGSSNYGLMHCVVINELNNGSARTVRFDDDCSFINNDFECSGAVHASVIDGDNRTNLYSNRIKSTGGDCATINYGTFVGNIFYGSSDHDGITILSDTIASSFRQNTFYGLNTAIYFSVGQIMVPTIVTNNFASDCLKWIDSAYVATANQPIIEVNNWLNNITTPRTGVSDFPVINQITTSGGATGSYFVDAAGGDFTLISGAPGRATGLWPFRDIGAIQHEDAGGGGGSAGPLIGPGRLVR